MKAILKKHPEIDFFIGFFGGPIIPAKQDKFKPLVGYDVIIEEDENKQVLNGYEVYLKQKDKNIVREFEENFKQQIKEQLTDEHPYTTDIKLEMIISVSMDEKRMKEVDIDNISKSIIDCFNGLVFIDDSQIQSLYTHKTVHPMLQLNGLMVGIRKINNKNESWFKNIKLAYFDYEE